MKTKEELRNEEIHPQCDFYTRNSRLLHTLLKMGLVVEPVIEEANDPDDTKLKRIKYFRVSTGFITNDMRKEEKSVSSFDQKVCSKSIDNNKTKNDRSII